jgi:hypothetical protein
MSLPDGAISHGVALYDPETGRIAHIQRVVVFPGAPDLTAEQVVQRAHVHARHGGHDVSRLELVHLPDDHDYATPHVVDLTTGTVVAGPPSGRGRPGAAPAA